MTPQQIELPIVVTVCAWCEPCEAASSLGFTHGICPRHLRKLQHEMIDPPSGRTQPGEAFAAIRANSPDRVGVE
jgi:hypothetical protein